MVEVSLPIEIPKRTLFKAAEVCDLVKVQPYVLRSWEGEFPELGVTKTAGGPRVYRRTDVEQVMRIKHLLLVEGLTLAGARRRLAEEAAPPPPPGEEIGPEARDRLLEIKQGLRFILDLLSSPGAGDEFTLRPPESPDAEPPAASASDTASARRNPRGNMNEGSDQAAPRRKRPAS